MTRRLLLVFCLLACAGGCGLAPATCNIAAPADLSAIAQRRAREEKLYEGIGSERLFEHAVQALMDLECTVRETDASLGFVSAVGRWDCTRLNGKGTASSSFINQLNPVAGRPACFTTCGGAEMQVNVQARGTSRTVVRVAPRDPSPRAVETFFRLLDNSLATEEKR